MSPSRASSAPLMMFPPPTTTAISAPLSLADRISSAITRRPSRSIPNPPGAQNASPESLSSTRPGAPDASGAVR